MDALIDFVYAHVDYAHWIAFGLLMLAGMNLPVSEDLVLITTGVLAASLSPWGAVHLFFWVFLGCYLSDWIAYWIGRKLGRRVLSFKWFGGRKTVSRVAQVAAFYRNYGVLTLFLGRFIPFGVRNILFLTAGISKMNFGKFIIVDGIACIISNTILFSIAYYCGKNIAFITERVQFAHSILAISVLLIVLPVVFIRWQQGSRKLEEQA